MREGDARVYSMLGIAGYCCNVCLWIGPEPASSPLVGKWTFDRVNMSPMSGAFINFLVSQGMNRAEAEKTVADAFASANDPPVPSLSINADGTWQADSGDKGAWKIEGDILAIRFQRFNLYGRLVRIISGQTAEVAQAIGDRVRAGQEGLLGGVSAELDIAPDYKGGRFHMFNAEIGLTIHEFLQAARQDAGV